MSEQEERWQIAVEFFPDLSVLRKRLSRTAHSLAFAFVTVILETKRFNDRFKICEALEQSFLEKYFGDNREIIQFVKLLISSSHREAVKAVNKYIDVLGSDISPEIIIDRVKKDFGLNTDILVARNIFLNCLDDQNTDRVFQAAWTLSLRLGYSPKLTGNTVEITNKYGQSIALESRSNFVSWILNNHF